MRPPGHAEHACADDEEPGQRSTARAERGRGGEPSARAAMTVIAKPRSARVARPSRRAGDGYAEDARRRRSAVNAGHQRGCVSVQHDAASAAPAARASGASSER